MRSIYSIVHRLIDYPEKSILIKTGRYKIFTLLFILILSCFCSGSVFAQTPSPDNVLFVKKGSAGDGSSWANAIGEFSEALSWASSNWDVHADGPLQIWVAAGKYMPTMNTDCHMAFQLVNGVRVYGGFSGTETVLTERNRAKHVTILSGDIDGDDETTVIMDPDKEIKGNNSYTVVNGSGTDLTAVLDGFIITAGSADETTEESQSPSNSGGGVYVYQGNPTLANLIIMGNQAGYGGGIYNQESLPSLTSVNISNNKAVSGQGDGIFNDATSRPVLNNVVISGTWNNYSGDYAITFDNSDISPILTVVAHPDQSKVYGADDPVLTYTTSGFNHGDNNSVFSGALSRNVGEDVGSYAINEGTLSVSPYTISFIGSDFTIMKAPQEISFTTPEEVSLSSGIVSLIVSSTSGLPITLSVDDPTVGTLSENDLNLLGLGTVTVTATQEGNDNYSAAEPVSITVEVISEQDDSIQVHQAVSPNGDGINDFLYIEGVKRFPENRLRVFNRTGLLVFEEEGYDNAGKTFIGISNTRGFSGSLQEGTYFYVFNYKVGSSWEVKRGWFVLKFRN